jgi:hypothetical protein
MRFWMQLFTSMRIRIWIQGAKSMRVHAGPVLVRLYCHKKLDFYMKNILYVDNKTSVPMEKA